MSHKIAPIRHTVGVIAMHSSPLLVAGSGDAGGLNIYVDNVTRRLAQAGHTVHTYTRKTSVEQPEFVQVQDRLFLHYIEAGPLDTPKEHLPSYVGEFAFNILATSSIAHCNIIHGHYWLSGWAASHLADALNVPFVQTFHTVGAMKNSTRQEGEAAESALRQVAEERILCNANAISAPSSAEFEYFSSIREIKEGSLMPCCYVIEPGIDTQLFKPLDRPVMLPLTSAELERMEAIDPKVCTLGNPEGKDDDDWDRPHLTLMERSRLLDEGHITSFDSEYIDHDWDSINDLIDTIEDTEHFDELIDAFEAIEAFENPEILEAFEKLDNPHGLSLPIFMSNPEGFKPNLDHPLEPFLMAKDFVQLLFVGRLQPLKGPDIAIETMARLYERQLERGLERFFQYRLMLVGGSSGESGFTHEDLSAYAESLKVRDYVFFRDAMAQEDLLRAYRKSHMVLMPSSSETFGLVAIEAQGCGVPVIASNVGGLPCAVGNCMGDDIGLGGVLVNDRTGEAFADAIENLVANPDEYARLRENAIARGKLMTWDRTVAKTLKMYDQVIREC